MLLLVLTCPRGRKRRGTWRRAEREGKRKWTSKDPVCWDSAQSVIFSYLNCWSVSPTIQFSSVAQSCPTLCDPMDHSTTGLPVHHQLLELTKPMSMALVMPSNHLILCPSLLLPPSVFPSKTWYQPAKAKIPPLSILSQKEISLSKKIKLLQKSSWGLL